MGSQPIKNQYPEIQTVVDNGGSMKILGSPPLGTKIFGTTMSDVRKQGNPHSTDRYTYGKK